MSLSLLTLLPLLSGGALQDVGLDNLQVGHYVEIRGALDSKGVLVAQKVEVMEPDNDLLIGTIEASPEDPDVFLLMGQPVHVSSKTAWGGRLTRSRVEGQRVKLEGRYRDEQKFSARKFSPRGPGRNRIGGRIDALRAAPGGWQARVLRFEVFIAADTEFEVEGDFAQLPLAPPRPPTDPGRSGEVDDDDYLGEGFQIAEGLTAAVQLEYRSRYEENFNTEFADDEDRFDNTLAVRTQIDWALHEDVSASIELLHDQRWRNDDDEPAFSRPNSGLGETFVEWRNAFGDGIDVIVGRQDFDERREWVYDQNLDGVRVIARREAWQLELSASTTLGGDDGPLDTEATNLIVYFGNGDDKKHLGAYAIYRNIDVDFDSTNPDDLSGQFVHLGARAYGEWFENHDSWLDMAFFSGHSTDPLSFDPATGAGASPDWLGFGFDVGSTWMPDSSPFNFTLGYAFGTGDNDLDGDTGNFRQTGLADNTDKLAGVTSFRYYGELTDPELANLAIFTLGAGMDLGNKTSLDLILHHYNQIDAADFMFGTDLGADPNGTDADIGWEVDLVLGSRRWEGFAIEAVLGWFRPGDAFDAGFDDDAILAKLQVRYRL